MGAGAIRNLERISGVKPLPQIHAITGVCSELEDLRSHLPLHGWYRTLGCISGLISGERVVRLRSPGAAGVVGTSTRVAWNRPVCP
jgi:hypothetical protein